MTFAMETGSDDVKVALREALRCRLWLRGATNVEIGFPGDQRATATFSVHTADWKDYISRVGRIEVTFPLEKGKKTTLNGRFAHSRIERECGSDQWKVVFSLDEGEERRLRPILEQIEGKEIPGNLMAGGNKEIQVLMPVPFWRTGEIRGGFTRQEAERVSYWIQCPPLPCRLLPAD